MKDRLLSAAALAFMLGSLALAGEPEPKRLPLLPKGRELAANPGFEEGSGDAPSGWFLHRPKGGMEVSWGDFGIAGSKGLKFSPPAGASGAVDEGACNQRLTTFEAGETLEVTAWIRLTAFEGRCFVWARCDGADGVERRDGAFENSQLAGYDLKGSTVWIPVTVRVTPAETTRAVVLGLVAGGRGTVEVDAVHARVRETGGAGPAAAGPGLFLAEGRYRITCTADVERLVIHVPVPLLWREQVPLSFRAWTEPAGLVASAKLVRRPHGHFFAEIVLHGLEKPGPAAFRWEALVLVKPHTPTPIPEGIEVPLKDVPADAAPWLAASWCCDAKHPEIVKIAEALRAQGSDARGLVPRTLERLQGILGAAKGFLTDLTAVEALTRQGSCTSNANLAAALLRAHGIPARVVAGYPSWSGPLQTHYVVEYWLPGGWRVMESTMCRDDWPGHGQIEVAVVLPADEVEEKAARRSGAAGAVPYLSLTEYPEGMKPALVIGDMPERRGCDHGASQRAVYEAAPEEWARAFGALAKRWAALAEKACAPDPGAAVLAPPASLGEPGSLAALVKALAHEGR